MHQTTRRAARPARIGRALLALAVALPMAACDSLLEVEDPDVLKPGQLDDESAIPLRVSGAVLDFQIAYNGNFNNALTIAQGLFTDEYQHVETFQDRLAVELRDIDRNDNQIIQFLFGGLHTARTSAVQAAELIEEFVSADEDDPLRADLGTMRTLQGYSEVFLAESFCSGVPASRIVDDVIQFGEPRTTAETLEDAVAAFDAALAADPSLDEARIGRGRALLDLGRFQDAAAAVAAVPTSFEQFVFHSDNSPAQENAIWNMATNGRISVADNEGDNGLPFRSADDPRVPWLDTNDVGFDQQSPLYLPLVAADIDTDIVLASGVEARLIEAEAALQRGDRATFFAEHNQARATVAGLAPLTDTGQSRTALENLHFRERAFWLYSTGHRLGDLRRLVRQYGRNAENVFPSGDYFRGGTYGSDVNFPIPVEEDNNPNTAPLTQGCIDRSA
jgi:starch-binding outer membrane protein, SusD/RagB family